MDEMDGRTDGWKDEQENIWMKSIGEINHLNEQKKIDSCCNAKLEST